MLPPVVSAPCRSSRVAPLFVGTVFAAVTLVLLACLLGTAPAQAATLIARADIAPGTLTVEGGAAHVNPADPAGLLVPIDVIDARGNGAGWSVFLSARPAAGPSSHFATVAAPAVSCTADATCTLPVSTIDYPLNVPMSGAAVKVLDAAPNTGMGGMATTLTLDGTPAGQTVNTTVTVASGP